MNPGFEIRSIVRSLGIQGAKAGILESKIWTIDALKKAASEFGIKTLERATRKDLIDEIVKFANKRITKSLDELYGMDADSLVSYLNEIEVESEELLDLLKQLDVSPRKEGLKNLIAFVAKELSETGRFMRISGTTSRSTDTSNLFEQ